MNKFMGVDGPQGAEARMPRRGGDAEKGESRRPRWRGLGSDPGRQCRWKRLVVGFVGEHDEYDRGRGYAGEWQVAAHRLPHRLEVLEEPIDLQIGHVRDDGAAGPAGHADGGRKRRRGGGFRAGERHGGDIRGRRQRQFIWSVRGRIVLEGE